MAQTPILDALSAFFKDDDWPITPVEGRTILRTAFKGDNGQWACFAETREEQQEFIFYSVCQNNTPEGKRPAMAEFITRANYGLYIGNFEMDYNDGEIRYKTSIDTAGQALPAPMIKAAVYANVALMDRYLPGIMAVMYNDSTTAAAEIQKIEGG